MLGALATEHGLGAWRANATAPARVLLAGGGAGGRGAMVTLDALPGMLQAAGVPPAAVTVQGLFDAPLLLPVRPASTRITTLQAQTQQAAGLVNATAAMGAACVAAYPAATAQWVCLYRALCRSYVPMRGCVR